MRETFSDDDVGKRVENANATEVGVVVSVDERTAYVDPDPDLTDSIRVALGWEVDREDAAPLDADSVREITDQVVRLEYEIEDRGETARTDRSTDVSETDVRDSGVGDGDDESGERAVSDDLDRREGR